MARTVFVTSGATVPFIDLIKNCLSESVLETLATLGYTRLIIQYGKGEMIYKSALPKSPPLKISGFDFAQDISKYIKSADLVISHAGTGSILDALRSGKRLLVVINDKLMDNHQMQISQELSNSKYLLQTTSDIRSLVANVEKSESFNFAPFPEPNSSKVASIIDHEAGI